MNDLLLHFLLGAPSPRVVPWVPRQGLLSGTDPAPASPHKPPHGVLNGAVQRVNGTDCIWPEDPQVAS